LQVIAREQQREKALLDEVPIEIDRLLVGEVLVHLGPEIGRQGQTANGLWTSQSARPIMLAFVKKAIGTAGVFLMVPTQPVNPLGVPAVFGTDQRFKDVRDDLVV
jgi:hypothetical protein